MQEKIKALIAKLESEHDFDDEFYQTYCCGLNDSDISDWYNSHFDDNVNLGFCTGQTSATENIIAQLNQILEGF